MTTPKRRRVTDGGPSPVFRWILIAVIALAVAVALAGCGTVMPDRAGLYATHTSVPFRGMGPAPVGDHNHSTETNYETIEGTLTWDVGKGWQVQSSMAYVVHSNNLDAPSGALFGARVGREVALTW